MIVMINLLSSNNHEQVDMMTHTYTHNLNARSTIIVELFLEYWN